MPTWVSTPGPVLLKHHTRTSKTDPLVDEVELLLQANPIRHADGWETTVSVRHLAPCGVRVQETLTDGSTGSEPGPTTDGPQLASERESTSTFPYSADSEDVTTLVQTAFIKSGNQPS